MNRHSVLRSCRIAAFSCLFAVAAPDLAADPAAEASDVVPEPPEEGEVLPRPPQPSEAADLAARFLLSRQREDGSWPGGPRKATTAWVLLALLYNQCPDGEWAEPADRGVRFLLDNRLSDGSFAPAGPARSRADAEAPVHALLAAARATGDPRIREVADAAARATFGTNEPPDFLGELTLLFYHPAFALAFREIQRERALSLVPAPPASGRPTGRWTSPPDYGDLARLLPDGPRVPRTSRMFLGTAEEAADRDILPTAASLLVPGAMGVTRRLPPSAEALAAADALAKARLDAPPAVFDEPRGWPRPGFSARACARRWLLARQTPPKSDGDPGGAWPGADPVVDTSLALLALALDDPDLTNARGENLSDACSRAVQYLARTIRPDGTFPVRDPAGDAAALPVLALRVLAGVCPHPDVRDLLRKAGADPDDTPAFFGERLLLAMLDSPQPPSVADWRTLSAAERAARRWEVRPASESGFRNGPQLLLHWEEPPGADYLVRGSPIPAAAFRPLPADASPEARALRATCRWLLVPPDKTVRDLVRPLPAAATNAPGTLFPHDIKVSGHRRAEVAE